MNEQQAGKNNIPTNSVITAKFMGFHTMPNMLYGLDEADTVGLELEERKRMRSDISVGLKDIEMGHDNSGIETEQRNQGFDISKVDLSAPKNNVLAELALQASRSK